MGENGSRPVKGRPPPSPAGTAVEEVAAGLSGVGPSTEVPDAGVAEVVASSPPPRRNRNQTRMAARSTDPMMMSVRWSLGDMTMAPPLGALSLASLSLPGVLGPSPGPR